MLVNKLSKLIGRRTNAYIILLLKRILIFYTENSCNNYSSFQDYFYFTNSNLSMNRNHCYQSRINVVRRLLIVGFFPWVMNIFMFFNINLHICFFLLSNYPGSTFILLSKFSRGYVYSLTYIYSGL